MAKRGQPILESGTAVRVKDGVSLPEFPEVSIAGWTGEIIESKGRGAKLQYIVQWDRATIDQMSQAYRDQCEERGLFFEMVCLPRDQVEPAE